MKPGSFNKVVLLPCSGFIIILALWQIMYMSNALEAAVFPGPWQVIASAHQYLTFERVMQHTGISLGRVLSGFIIGSAAGVILGILSGWYPLFGKIMRTPIELIRPIPPLGWIPLAIIWLGLGESSKILIISLGAFFPVFTNCYKGMVGMDPNLIRVGQTLGLGPVMLFRRVILPAAMPSIAIGLSLGWGYSFGCMVAAELIASKSGLGYMIMNARQLGYIGVIIFGIVLIGILNLITDAVIKRFFLKKHLHWAFSDLG